MTDPPSHTTHTAPPVVEPFYKAASLQAPNNERGDEPEDYTIKCICGFEDDDGNTVYCETCDTWQHTECYYINKDGTVPPKQVLDEYNHLCADCQPRPLDTRGAEERQKQRRHEPSLDDRKVKKPTSKSHKKKIRLPDSNDSLTNGWAHGADFDLHDRTSRSPRDPHPPAKKPKTNHRFSSSMNIPSLSNNATSNSRKRSGSAVQSPAKTHGKYSSYAFAKEPYSFEFIHLYDNDPGDTSMRTNLFNGIDITDDLMNWSCDIDELEKATNGLTPQDVFVRYEQPVASMTLPQLNTGCRKDESSLIHGQHPTWKYLTIDSFTPKDSIVAELKGKIGHMQRYIHDPANRWDYLRHPAPFVFFHPKLPIYIDTRSEGTACRYLRRSCDPNLSMKTSLENQSEYHFCFVAKQDLDPGSELTIGWVLDEHIRNYFSSRNQDNVKLEGDLDEDYVADWVGKVLAEFGGCACNSPHTCALAKYDRRLAGLSKGRNGYSGKQSPTNTGDAVNSRAGSEQYDGRSSSGSKSRSRDMTPTNQASSGTTLGAGMEISDREKRKIAALEKNFEQLENDKNQPVQKKKKRNSGGSTVNTPAAGTSKQLGHAVSSVSQPSTPCLPFKPQYADVGTSRRQTGSPTIKSPNPVGRPRTNTTANSKKRSSHTNTPLIPSPLIRQNYVNSSVQTEPEDEDAWYRPTPVPVAVRKPYMSLTKRLLLRSQQDHAKSEERRRAFMEHSDSSMANGQHATDVTGNDASQEHEDEKMRDGSLPPSVSVSTTMDIPNHTRPPDRSVIGDDSSRNTEIKPPPRILDSEPTRATNGIRPTDLRVQLPPRPSMSSDPSVNTSLVETPTSAVPQSPSLQNNAPSFSQPSLLSGPGLIQPSPIKKKVSLGEYFASRRKGSQSAADIPTSSSPTMQQEAFKVPSRASISSKDAIGQGSALADTLNQEESDPLAPGDGKDSRV